MPRDSVNNSAWRFPATVAALGSPAPGDPAFPERPARPPSAPRPPSLPSQPGKGRRSERPRHSPEEPRRGEAARRGPTDGSPASLTGGAGSGQVTQALRSVAFSAAAQRWSHAPSPLGHAPGHQAPPLLPLGHAPRPSLAPSFEARPPCPASPSWPRPLSGLALGPRAPPLSFEATPPRSSSPSHSRPGPLPRPFLPPSRPRPRPLEATPPGDVPAPPSARPRVSGVDFREAPG